MDSMLEDACLVQKMLSMSALDIPKDQIERYRYLYAYCTGIQDVVIYLQFPRYEVKG